MAMLFEAPHLARTGGSDPFTIEVRVLGKTVLPAGHETITRRAARPLVGAGLLTPADVMALVAGVRSVDENPLGLALPSLQRQHFLRATLCQPVRGAYRQALARLYNRFEAALAASGTQRFRAAGEALHLIQDSFSEAHTERAHTPAGPTGAIRFVRFYGLRGKAAPVEHKLVGDQRDLIAVAGAAARAAQRASTAFLRMLLAAARPGTTKPARALLFARYVRAFVPLDPAHRTTRSVYPNCSGPAVSGPARVAEYEVEPGIVNRVIGEARTMARSANGKSASRRAISQWLNRTSNEVKAWIDRASPAQIDAVVGALGSVEAAAKIGSTGALNDLRRRALARLHP